MPAELGDESTAKQYSLAGTATCMLMQFDKQMSLFRSSPGFWLADYFQLITFPIIIIIILNR